MDLFFQPDRPGENRVFPGFNSGSCEDDPADLFIEKRIYCHGHSEVCFPGTCRSYADHHVVLSDRFDIFFLVPDLGTMNFFFDATGILLRKNSFNEGAAEPGIDFLGSSRSERSFRSVSSMAFKVNFTSSGLML